MAFRQSDVNLGLPLTCYIWTLKTKNKFGLKTMPYLHITPPEGTQVEQPEVSMIL